MIVKPLSSKLPVADDTSTLIHHKPIAEEVKHYGSEKGIDNIFNKGTGGVFSMDWAALEISEANLHQ